MNKIINFLQKKNNRKIKEVDERYHELLLIAVMNGLNDGEQYEFAELMNERDKKVDMFIKKTSESFDSLYKRYEEDTRTLMNLIDELKKR